jgi:Spy/CpxP family protein refolding chaperone
MKAKSILILAALMVIMPITLQAATQSGESDATNRIVVAVSAQDGAIPQDDTVLSGASIAPTSAPRGPKELLQAYEAGMAAITQRFSTTLVDITQAVHRGELTSEQGQKASTEQYLLAQMQFELLAAWRAMLEQDLARIPVPAAEATTAPVEDNEVVTVALPFSSFHFNSSLAEYLSLSKSQADAIQEVTMRERPNLQALIAQLRTTREEVLSANPQRTRNREIKALADRQAGLLAKLIVANARMKSHIYKLLTQEQQQKLNDLAQSRESITSK